MTASAEVPFRSAVTCHRFWRLRPVAAYSRVKFRVWSAATGRREEKTVTGHRTPKNWKGTQMRKLLKTTVTIAAVASLILLTQSAGSAQKLPKRVHIQAQAMGTAQQLGRNAGVNLIIEEQTSPEERAGMLEAFQSNGNEGLVNALSKMHSKGRMAVIGTLGYDIKYVWQFKQPNGNILLRVVTDRPLLFGEVWASTRSRDYELAGLEIMINKNGKNHTGTLYPACRLKLNKKGVVELQLYQNPWKLVNIRRR